MTETWLLHVTFVGGAVLILLTWLTLGWCFLWHAAIKHNDLVKEVILTRTSSPTEPAPAATKED